MWNNIDELNGWRPITTFWSDFDIADRFGKEAVLDTYNRAFKEWRYDYRYLTELVMVLNQKCWQWYKIDNELSELYCSLFEVADNYAIENLGGAELKYFLEITD